MVIVITHALASAYLFSKDPDKFLRNKSQESETCKPDAQAVPSEGIGNVYIQEAFLPLLEAKTVAELRTAIRKALTYILPQVTKANVYLRSPETARVETDGRKSLPAKGLAWKAYQQRQQIVQPISSPQDPVITALALDEDIQQSQLVLCLPIQDREDNENIGLIVASLPPGKTSCSATEEGNLTYLAKQVSVCYHLTKNSVTRRRSICADDTHFEALINLCGELYDHDAASLQLKVIKYLEQRTQAQTAFLLLVVKETNELFCQVVGTKILQEEVRFPGETSSFAVALQTKQPICLEDIPQDRRAGLEDHIGLKLESFLCVPVRRKSSDDLIALACVANKKGTIGFTSEDVYAIHQCFQYTATVLTSTLAFQNERKLKIQTQALLHVAKNLFTRLGEFVFALGKHFCAFNKVSTSFSDCLYSTAVTMSEQYHESFNNSSLLAYTSMDTNIIKQLQQQEKLANALTNSSNNRSPEKAGKLDHKFHPKLKSPNVKVSKDEPGKKAASVSPYKRKPKASAESDPPMPTKDQAASGDFFNSSDEDLDLHQVSPMSGTEKYFSPVFTDVSCDEYLSVGLSEDIDGQSSSSGIMADEDDDDMTCKQRFFDIWVEATLKLKTSRSDSCIISENISSQLPDIVKTVDSDRGGSQVHISVSEPTLAKTGSQGNTSFTILGSSSNFLNTAFIDEDFSSMEQFNSELALTLNMDDRQLSEQTVIVEDTETQVKHIISTKHVPYIRSFSEIPTNTTSWLRHQQELWTPSTYVMSQIQVPIARGNLLQKNDLTKLLREIMQEARNLTHAERCSVFLIDPETDELVAKVFDGISANDKEVQQEIRMPKTQGIAGHVATTGNLLNIPDAYSHPLFYRGIDDSTGFKTRNILCFPIKDEEEEVLGVAQLCNKKTGPYFTVFDEDIASAFAVYCCISISHCLMYKKVQDAQHRNNLSNELMIYHMQVTTDEVRDLISSDMLSVHVISPIFDKFCYAPRTIPEADTPVACLSMFEDLGLIAKFRIRKDTLARFVLMVKRGYRNPPYHNWMHAYAVAHFCYLLVKNLHLEKHLKEIEVFALFVACLCHDIDHRGTTNSFQVQSESVLAALYSSEGSVMERHHFAQSMCIVNTEGCNIFEHLSSSDYQHVLDLMRDIILATDLAHHLRILGDLGIMAEKGYDSTKPNQRNMLLCLLMTSCDLSDQTKDWNNTKHIAAQVYQEFFSQGDLEKAVGKDPIEMMDREKACIPDLQINFLDGIALPVYRILEKLFPECKEVNDAVEKNKLKWVRIGQLLKMRRGTSTQGLSMEQILTLEDDDEEAQEQHNGR
ncbi:cGMP-dependent 3',5'-cyclic phosphodiesterase-like isoform X1 [Haliotis rufescens]|uniref:cGMP-dependent 3',5'-cyclic phosphodiesterase-like isoform X1 n=1 Tax=Haliotis rufescens TaxID=6454 RepID=UPI001EAFE6BB|nr:cGMP-dependent 3',5'-cyclic phosphodiesterase-like isoform X1 [Haliotis rufescens]